MIWNHRLISLKALNLKFSIFNSYRTVQVMYFILGEFWQFLNLKEFIHFTQIVQFMCMEPFCSVPLLSLYVYYIYIISAGSVVTFSVYSLIPLWSDVDCFCTFLIALYDFQKWKHLELSFAFLLKLKYEKNFPQTCCASSLT